MFRVSQCSWQWICASQSFFVPSFVFAFHCFLFACFSSDSLVYINSNILEGAPCDVQGKRECIMLSSCGYFIYFFYILIFTFSFWFVGFPAPRSCVNRKEFQLSRIWTRAKLIFFGKLKFVLHIGLDTH